MVRDDFWASTSYPSGLGKNAFVFWIVTEEPWEADERLIRSPCLPLNLAQNSNHPFHARLSACRSSAKERAMTLPIYCTRA